MRIPHYGRMFRRAPVQSVVETVAAAPAPVAEIVPEPVASAPDWRAMSWPQMRSLAASVTNEPIRNREIAERVLAAKFG